MGLSRNSFFLRFLSSRILYLAIVLMLVSCSRGRSGDEVKVEILDPQGKQVAVIQAEVVSKTATRSLGLMYRYSLEADRGMLFVFPDEAPRSFWMKNTNIPLDILFIDAQKRIVSISENTTPLSTKSIPSQHPAQFVLEINAGASRKLGIDTGNAIVIHGHFSEPE